MAQQTNGNILTHANGTTRPALRPLDIRHHNENGHPYLLLRDPLELSEQMIAVPQPLASVLAFCDGTHDIDGMAAAFTDYFQTPIDVAVVHQLVEALDNAYLLDNQRSQQAVAKVVEAYRSAPFRTPLLAGRGYPDDPAELHGLLQDYLEQASATPTPADQWPRRAGLLSPHIDYARGGAVYAEVWKSAAEAAKAAELVVIFGTDHYGNDPFTFTRQNYATPYGVLPTAQSIVNELALLLGEDAAFAGELRHRDEHSLELVAVWLHHMRGGEPVEIVPILTGSLRRAGRNGDGPASDSTAPDPTVEALLAKLDELAGDRRVLVIASGDLAHVGPAFGGAPLNVSMRKQVRLADDELLTRMQAGDAEGFRQSIDRVDNRHNVCGVSPVYLTMRLVGKDRTGGSISGEPFGYATCPADDHDISAVTVAGMVFR